MLSYHTCPLAVLGGKDTGGMNVYVRELTRFLGQAGIHVDVFTRSQDEHVPHVLHDLGYGNRVVHIPAGPEHPLPKSELAAHLPQFIEGILDFSEHRGLQYDLVHSHYWMSGIAGGELKQLWNVPMVHMFHTLGAMKNRVARAAHEAEGSYRLEGEQRVIDLADRIIAATPAEVNQMQSHYRVDNGKISVIPPGVDTGHFYPIHPDEAKAAIGVPLDARMLLFVGRIEPLKGIDTLLKAIAKMREECVRDLCPYYLAIIGGDPEDAVTNPDSEIARMQRLCSRLGLDDMVVFLGKRDQATLPYYYSASQVLVMPSFYESFGMVALESMACGTPVVASHTGGLAYLVRDGETGFTVPSGDVTALANRLTQLIFDEELHAEISKRAADYARSYAWQTVTGRILSLYRDLTGNANGTNGSDI